MIKNIKSYSSQAVHCMVGLLVLTQFSCETKPEETSPTKSDQIDAVVLAYADNNSFNGSILVTQKGEIIYKKAFGLANMEWDILNKPDTKFRIASLTKQFTAMVAVQLVAEGRLDLRVPISTYLPDFPKGNGDKITLHHLLSHTSGIPEVEHGDKENVHYKPAELVASIEKAPLEFSPGERFEYSNSGYVLAGYIIETVTGKAFEEVLKEKILNPLQMKNTGMDNPRSVMSRRASGYFKGGGQFWNADYHDMSKAYTAGAMYSTVEDLHLWDRALYTEVLAPKEYIDLIFKKHAEDPTYGGHYGYGWELGPVFIGNTSEKVETVRHDGVINGFCALMTRIPSTETCIVLLANTRRAALNSITGSTIAILNGKPYDLPKKSVAIALTRLIESSGTDSLTSWLDDMEDASRYYLDEDEMNMAGYGLLQNEMSKEAAALFLINVEKFPKSFNAHDSYGEALLVMGDTLGAIRGYKKSLELNPENENGALMLHRIED